MPFHPLESVVPLAVDLLNGRNYVQGSQTLARLCGLPVLEGATLLQARFTRITDRLVGARLRGAVVADPAVIGDVDFVRDSVPFAWEIVELEGMAPVAARPTAIVLEGLDDDGALCGQCRFSGALGIEGVLDVLVQAIKALHQRLAEPTCDIWFTGLREWHLPVRGPTVPAAGALQVRCLRRSSAGVRHQSLLRAAISGEGLAPAEGLVTFAWRTQKTA